MDNFNSILFYLFPTFIFASFPSFTSHLSIFISFEMSSIDTQKQKSHSKPSHTLTIPCAAIMQLSLKQLFQLELRTTFIRLIIHFYYCVMYILL